MGALEVAKRIEAATEWHPEGTQPDGVTELESLDSGPELIQMGSEGAVQPKNWLIKGILGQGELSVLFAPSGGGKSFVALDMAARIATDLTWFGHKVEPTCVLYVAGEGATGFKHRMTAWRQDANIEEAAFHLMPSALDLFSENSTGCSKIQAAIAKIRLQKQMGVGLIVLDTLSRMMPGGVDSDPRDMKMFLNQIEKLRLQTGAHVMLVHHTGKEKDRGMRGSSMLRDYADTVFEVQPPTDGGPHHIKIDKQKDGRDGVTFMCYIKPVTLGIDDDDDAITSCVLAPVGDAENPGNPSTTGQARIALDALIEALKTDGSAPPVTAEYENVTVLVTLEAWEMHFIELFKQRKKPGFTSDGARRTAWSRVKKRCVTKD